jgi:hypothetical protein
VAVSLQGAAQLLGSAGNIVMTGQYAKRSQALSVRVFAGTPTHGCWLLPAVIMPVAPVATAMFPPIAEIGKKAATRAVTAITNFVIAKISKQPSETARALDTVDRTVTELGLTARAVVAAAERMAAYQRPAVRNLVAPVGASCATVRVGNLEDAAIPITAGMRSVIDEPEPIEITSTAAYDIFISELDHKNHTCKFYLRDSDDPDHVSVATSLTQRSKLLATRIWKRSRLSDGSPY